MGLFIIGEIQSEEIKDLIQKYFGGFKNTEETIDPDYKVPDFNENLFFIGTLLKTEDFFIVTFDDSFN